MPRLVHIDFQPADWGEFTAPPRDAPGAVDEALSDLPLAYWRLGDAGEATLDDASGNANHATAVGSGLTPADSLLAWEDDAALAFSGDGSRLDTPIAREPVDGFTLTAWIRIDTAPPSGGAYAIVAQRSGAGTGRTWLGLAGSGAGGDFLTHLGGVAVHSGFTPQLGRAHHVALALDADGTYRWIIDGETRNTGTLTAESADGSLVVGVANDLTSDPFAGILDETAIFSDALSDQRIRSHYHAGVAR